MTRNDRDILVEARGPALNLLRSAGYQMSIEPPVWCGAKGTVIRLVDQRDGRAIGLTIGELRDVELLRDRLTAILEEAVPRC